jgi:hypothetical protein
MYAVCVYICAYVQLTSQILYLSCTGKKVRDQRGSRICIESVNPRPSLQIQLVLLPYGDRELCENHSRYPSRVDPNPRSPSRRGVPVHRVVSSPHDSPGIHCTHGEHRQRQADHPHNITMSHFRVAIPLHCSTSGGHHQTRPDT